MIYNETKLWQHLLKNDIVKFIGDRIEHPEILFDKHSAPFIIFDLNINRTLILYPDLLRMPKPNKNYIDFRYIHFCEIIIMCLITSMEVYLVDVFKKLSSQVTIENIDKRKFVNFLRALRLEKDYLDSLKEYGNNNIPLSKIIPERIDFQQKDKCKIAYSLLGIDLPTIADKEQKIWGRIFGDTENSYTQIRHNIIHRGVSATARLSQKLDIELVQKAILDITKFISLLESIIVSKYPKSAYPDLYPQPSK